MNAKKVPELITQIHAEFTFYNLTSDDKNCLFSSSSRRHMFMLYSTISSEFGFNRDQKEGNNMAFDGNDSTDWPRSFLSFIELCRTQWPVLAMRYDAV